MVASRYRDDLFDCLTARGDELFELADALLCADGPVSGFVDGIRFWLNFRDAHTVSDGWNLTRSPGSRLKMISPPHGVADSSGPWKRRRSGWRSCCCRRSRI